MIKKIYLAVLILLFVSGCATTQKFDNKNQLKKSPCACLEVANG